MKRQSTDIFGINGTTAMNEKRKGHLSTKNRPRGFLPPFLAIGMGFSFPKCLRGTFAFVSSKSYPSYSQQDGRAICVGLFLVYFYFRFSLHESGKRRKFTP